MSTNEQKENIDLSNDADETGNDEQEQLNPEVDQEKEELKKKLATLEAQKDHWRKKANEKKDDKTHNNYELSPKDLLAAMRAGIEDDSDIDEVLEYATFKKIPFHEALKNDVVKTILSNRAEFRKTAEIANTENQRKTVQKVSNGVLLDNLKKGDIPTSKSEAEALFWARRGRTKK